MRTFSFHFIWFPIRYLLWHYTSGVVVLLSLFVAGIRFLWDFFGVRFLLGSFFEPWGRPLVRSTGGSADAWFAARITNTIMRTVGVVFRAILLAVSACVFLSLCFIVPLVFFGWLIAPVLIYVLFFIGVVLLAYAFSQ